MKREDNEEAIGVKGEKYGAEPETGEDELELFPRALVGRYGFL